MTWKDWLLNIAIVLGVAWVLYDSIWKAQFPDDMQFEPRYMEDH